MAQQTIDLRVNPSDETIRLGPLAVRFLLTGDNSTGSIAAFELVVPGAQRLAAPAPAGAPIAARELSVMKSTPLPSGAVYSRLGAFPLGPFGGAAVE